MKASVKMTLGPGKFFAKRRVRKHPLFCVGPSIDNVYAGLYFLS